MSSSTAAGSPQSSACGAVQVPVARGRLISTRLPALEANLWRALKPTSDWTSGSVNLFAPSTTPGAWSKLVNDVRRNNGTSGRLAHEVHDRIHYALGGAPPTSNPPNASGRGRDGRLEVVLETLRDAEFRLLSRATWRFCKAYDFSFDFPSAVRASTRATRAPVRPLHDRAEAVWQRAATDGADEALDDEEMPVLMFHRGVGTIKESGMYFERKLGLVALYIQRAVLRLLCRIVCKAACGCVQKVSALKKRCARVEAWGDAPPSSGDISPTLVDVRKDAPARFVRRALLPQQLPTLKSVFKAFFKNLTLEEVTLREVVTVSARAPAAFAETGTKFDLALYDEIPCADAEMLCDVELYLRPLDLLKIGVTAAAALYVCVPMLFSMWLRRDEGLAMHHMVFVASLGGAISKILASFHASRDAAQTRLERMLLKRTESKQEGVLLTLASAAYKQECKEEILGYAALFSLRQATIDELRDRAEEIVEFRGTQPGDFEACSRAPAEEMRIDLCVLRAPLRPPSLSLCPPHLLTGARCAVLWPSALNPSLLSHAPRSTSHLACTSQRRNRRCIQAHPALTCDGVQGSRPRAHRRHCGPSLPNGDARRCV